MTRFILRLSLAAVFGFTGLAACSAPTSNVGAIASPDYASAPLDLSTPENTAYSMMIAMYRGEIEIVDAVFAEGGNLLRMKPDGTVSENGLPRWREWVGTLRSATPMKSCLRSRSNNTASSPRSGRLL